jgi:phage protein D
MPLLGVVLGLSELRQPRLTVLANGVPIGGAVAADVQSNSHLGANRFSVHATYDKSNLPFWAALPLLLDIQVSIGGAQASLVIGYADSLDVDPVRGEAVLHGRDLTSVFISAQTAETFLNQTASGIAGTLAARRGLAANIANSTGLVGRMYQIDRTRSLLSQHSRATSEWDLLTWLADQEGCDVWVDGTTLNFLPFAAPTMIGTVTPTTCSSLRIHRLLDLAAGMQVVVKSWNSQAQQVVAEAAESAPGSSGGVTLTAVRANLSSADALGLAQTALAQLSAHAVEISFEMPGDLTTMPRGGIMLSGTGTSFDGTYEVAEVERRISFERGFTQSVLARGLPWTPS